jgi:hypothetical protein
MRARLSDVLSGRKIVGLIMEKNVLVQSKGFPNSRLTEHQKQRSRPEVAEVKRSRRQLYH